MLGREELETLRVIPRGIPLAGAITDGCPSGEPTLDLLRSVSIFEARRVIGVDETAGAVVGRGRPTGCGLTLGRGASLEEAFMAAANVEAFVEAGAVFFNFADASAFDDADESPPPTTEV